jgi:hypothetical protein
MLQAAGSPEQRRGRYTQRNGRIDGSQNQRSQRHAQHSEVSADCSAVSSLNPYLPESLAEPAHAGSAEERLIASDFPEGILDVPGGKPPGVHLQDEFLQYVGPLPHPPPEPGTEGLVCVSDLRQIYRKGLLRGEKPAELVAVAIPGTRLAGLPSDLHIA